MYVGITNNLQQRLSKHKSDAKHNSPCVIHKAIRKYGFNNFTVTLLQTSSSNEELCELEKDWIAKLNTHVSVGGYNETFGGEAPMLGRFHTEETKNKIRKKLQGKTSPNKGKKWTNETRQKLQNRCKKSVIQSSIDGMQVAVYNSIKDASLATKIADSNISGVCRDKKKTAGGFRWKYQTIRSL